MAGPEAPRGYVEEALAVTADTHARLDATSRRCLEAAQSQSRQMDDNHVGTEHVVLGVLVVDEEIADRLAAIGITERVFRAQLFDEPGPSPDGTIPLTPRARMILGLASAVASAEGSDVTPRHLVLGVIAESRDWHERGFDGPHHLEQAAAAAGTDLSGVEACLGHRSGAA